MMTLERTVDRNTSTIIKWGHNNESQQLIGDSRASDKETTVKHIFGDLA